MRPKTFPATTYSGNSRQRLQEIREGLKQPSKASTQGLLVGPNSDTSLDAKVLGSKDASRQQQMRATPKFGPYQKALREIRYSLLPFANESGTSAAAEVNRQMLQELVNAGCDQIHIASACLFLEMLLSVPPISQAAAPGQAHRLLQLNVWEFKLGPSHLYLKHRASHLLSPLCP
uniref:Large tumor suppressor 2 n=1 Tax=Mus spicilegus TaxID=10103 RepID=A0A8C6H5Y0_MUSSI